MPAPAPIRDDLDEPVLVFQAETDVLGGLAGTRRPDTDTYRLWEVAGTEHFDQYGLVHGLSDVGDGQGAIDDLAAMRNPTTQPNPLFTCSVPINIWWRPPPRRTSGRELESTAGLTRALLFTDASV